MKAGIVGCGFIGSQISEFLDANKGFELIGLNDIAKDKAADLIEKLRNSRPKLMNLSELIKKSDFIVESASKDIVKDILKNKNLDKKNKILLVMSTGGLIENLSLLNKTKNCRILLPSGAVAGLDAIKSVSGKIKSLTLTTTKPIKGLEDAPFIAKNGINIRNLKNKKTIFEGSLKDAVNGFPQNINVAATLHLASKFKKIKIRIIADPNAKYNAHEIEAAGDFGIIKTTTNNLPSKNPKTSYLAVLSAIQAIKDIKYNLKIGN
ncbi:DUF108 domain-containing protein [Candidatus Woesearchaeota archaeon]|nr:DUF108 domain-containing protein [Candidatus Woesearchaeota archaeon]